MNTFEIGKKYFDTSACDHNCVFVIEITKRTAKTVTFLRDGKERRAKIHTDGDGEFIIPERYSMAPVFRASREYVEAPVEEVPTTPDPVAAYIPQALQPQSVQKIHTASGQVGLAALAIDGFFLQAEAIAAG